MRAPWQTTAGRATARPADSTLGFTGTHAIDWLHSMHRFRRRSFRSADAIVGSSRKLARRRADGSVVSSVLSIRRDRRSTSDLSIARRSRSSISSFKDPGPRPSADAKKLFLAVGRRVPRFRLLDGRLAAG